MRHGEQKLDGRCKSNHITNDIKYECIALASVA